MAHYALKKQPRTTTRALTDCVVTRADGTQYVIPKAQERSSKLSDAQKLRNAKARALARQNAKIDAQNAIDARKLNVRDGKYGTIRMGEEFS